MREPVRNGYRDPSGGGISMAEASSNRVALLLAGGDGARLRDLTSEISGIPIPKQYCRLLNGVSLLETAISRARILFPLKRINVIINEDHIDLARDQVRTLPAANIFVQPLNRDTGPGMVFALLTLASAYGDAIVAVFPTDHYVDKNYQFIAHVMHALNAVSYMPDKIVLLGITPDRPEAGYGYIMPAAPLKIPGNMFHVDAFTEKPNASDAAEIIERGGLWNSLVMVFRLSRMLQIVHSLAPPDVDDLFELRHSPEKAAMVYRTMRPWNFSSTLLARIPQHLIVLKVSDIFWSDWGTRESIERTCALFNLAPSWKPAKAIGEKIPQIGQTGNGPLNRKPRSA